MLRSSLEEVVQTSLGHSKSEVGKTSARYNIQWCWSSSPPSLLSLLHLSFSLYPFISLSLSLSLLPSLQGCDSLESVSSCSEELEDNVPIPLPLEDGVILEFASLPPTRNGSLATRSLSATQRRGRPPEEEDKVRVVEAVQQENRALEESPAGERNGGSSLVADCNIPMTQSGPGTQLTGESWSTSEESTVHEKPSHLVPPSPDLRPVSSSTPELGSQGTLCVLDSGGDSEGEREANLSKAAGGCVSESLTEETLRVITQKVRRMDTR